MYYEKLNNCIITTETLIRIINDPQLLLLNYVGETDFLIGYDVQLISGIVYRVYTKKEIKE